MTRIVQEIPDGACIVDCVTRVTSLAMARAMKADGVDGVFQYVGKISSADPGLLKAHVDNIVAAGMGFLGMCFADQFDGKYRCEIFRAAGALDGLTLGMDLESYRKPAEACILALNACDLDITSDRFLPELYNGAQHPLSGEQLGRLRVEHYHRSLSASVPMPTLMGVPIGYTMIQHLGDPRDPKVNWREVKRGGVNVDINTSQADNKGRRLTWMIDLNERPTAPELPDS